ncbi:RINGv domain containing protein [Ceratobasidium theobromae]|uniref:RINGv domain containing protein n=1 Tax=Ceratobasidium theobromae TaxID=1582974 RepID=A0A5N5QGU0_9AGAM|nr:RINGv domain containing protein [Ceratobasidium theobromae]
MPIPTVYDLKTRICWICMEEESHPITPSDKPRWIHPCKCTLVAHEICLLTWISESTAPGGQTSTNATCCPQCKTPYQIVSNKSTLLALMAVVEMGGVVVRKVAMFNGIFFGLLIPATAYGAITARLILGQDMYSFLIGNNPFQWSYATLVHLPFISLAFQGTQITQARSLLQIMCISLPMLAYDSAGSPSPTSIFSYPPSPTVVLAFLPCVQAAYGFAKQKLFDIGAEAIIRFAAYRIRRRLQQHHDTIRRRRPNSQRLSQDQAVEQPEQPQAPEVEEQAQVPAPRIEPATPTERPPVSFLFTTTLLFPFISSAAGSALLSLSEHSPSIRTLIGLRKDGVDRYFSRPIASITGLGFGTCFFDRLTTGLGGDRRMTLRRGWSWEDFEPVWWRNVLGYAIYVVIHDAWDLVYAWLRVTERRSRKVVDRAFDGIDLGSLDLRDSWRLGAN